jgi:hypothetical protein
LLALVILGAIVSSPLLVQVGTWERPAFERQVLGATDREVRFRIGEPDKVAPIGCMEPRIYRNASDYYRDSQLAILDPQCVLWTYRSRTRDPKTGKVDRVALVVLKYGRVKSVDYEKGER